MHKRTLGKSGIQFLPLAFGGNVFGWTLDEAASFRMLDEFVASGFSFIDTADVYSRWVPGHEGGESETIIGNWLRQRGNRDRVIIATKVGMPMGPDRQGLSRAHILRSADESLRRLQTDHIDLYQSHADDAETPLEETLSAYQELIKLGKVRAIGASNYSGPRLAQALDLAARKGLPHYDSLQPLYNLYDRGDYQRDLEPVCRKYGLAVITYSSLAGGFLTGKYRSQEDLRGAARAEGVRKYMTPRGEAILGALNEVGRAHDVPPATVALAWLLARPGITAPIASATRPEQLQSLTAALHLELDPAEIEALDRASAP